MGVRRLGRCLLVVMLLGALAGCGIATVEGPDPAQIPSGPLPATGVEPTGEIVELGRGRALGVGWRYSIYPSADGWCTQLEMTSLTSSACGELPPSDGSVFGGMGRNGAGSEGPAPVEGLVSEEVAEVWLVPSDGQRIEAMLMPLDEAGLEGKAFLGFAPMDAAVRAVVAIDADGQELETRDLP